jgi:hypothetical protein
MSTSTNASIAPKWHDSASFGPWLIELGGRHPFAYARAITAPDHITIFGTPQVAPTTEPGPPNPILDTDAAAERAVKEMAFKIRSEQLDKFKEERVEDLAFKTAITTESPPEAIKAISHGVHGLLRHTTSTMLAALRTIYGTVSATTFEVKKANMPMSCNPNPADIVNLINEHRQVHDLGESVGQPFSEAEKVSKLIAAMPKEFQMNVLLFKNNFPTLAARTFAVLAPLMITAAEDFAANAIMVANSALLKPPSVTPFPANRPQPAAKPLHYCWTHGKCRHPSDACNGKASGHQDRATFKNTMGGKDATVVWARGMTPGP